MDTVRRGKRSPTCFLKVPPRNHIHAWLAAGVVVLLVAAVAVTLTTGPTPHPTRDRADSAVLTGRSGGEERAAWNTMSRRIPETAGPQNVLTTPTGLPHRGALPGFFDPGPQPRPKGLSDSPPTQLPSRTGEPTLTVEEPKVLDGGLGAPNVRNDYVHWGAYQWAGSEPMGKVRAFFLFDRTGNPRLHGLIAAWASYINLVRSYYLPGLPYVAYIQDDANVGQCWNFDAYGYSFATVCDRPVPGAYGALTPIHPDYGPNAAHFAGPYVDIDSSQLPTYEGLKDVVIHELGHLAGLGHSSNATSIMCVPACNYPEPGTGRFYDVDDFGALAFLYYAHDVTEEP